MTRTEIRLAGAGGQGIVTAGRLLAEAAILCGLGASQSQAYGPQSRGGASRADVVIGEGTVGFPLVDDIDYLIILSDMAFAKYYPQAGEDCHLFVDTRSAPESLNANASTFPLTDTARAVSGGVLVTGVMALGVLQAASGIVKEAALRHAIEQRIPLRHRALNLDAFDRGMAMARALVPRPQTFAAFRTAR